MPAFRSCPAQYARSSSAPAIAATLRPPTRRRPRESTNGTGGLSHRPSSAERARECRAGRPAPAQDAPQDPSGIPQAGEDGAVKDRGPEHFFETVLQRPQGPQEIPAVHGGNVAGLERGQGSNVVPVQQVTLEALQARDRPHGERKLLDDLVHGLVPEITRRENAQDPQADVGGAGAHRHFVPRGDLVVVRRQPRGLGAHEIVEIAPRSPGDLPEESRIGRGQGEGPLLRARFQVQEPGRQGREKPGGQPRAGAFAKPDGILRSSRNAATALRDADQDHADHEGPRTFRAGAGEILGGGPLEHPPVGERTGDTLARTIASRASPAWWGRKAASASARSASWAMSERAEPAQPPPRGHHGERLCQGAEEKLRGDDQGGDQARGRRDGPACRQQADAGRRYEAAAQVVEELPAVVEGKGIPFTAPAVPRDPSRKPTARSASRRGSSDAAAPRTRRSRGGTRRRARCRSPGPTRTWAPSIRSWLSRRSSGKRPDSTRSNARTS